MLQLSPIHHATRSRTRRAALIAVASLVTAATSTAQAPQASPQDKALATIVKSVYKKVGKNGLQHRASFSPEDWSRNRLLVRIDRDETPLFSTPSFQSSTLTVVAIVRTGELLEGLGQRETIHLMNPLGRIPDDSGLWYLVRLLDSKTGWLFVASSRNPELRFASVLGPPAGSRGPGPDPALQLGLALIATIVIVILIRRRARTAGVGASGGVSGGSAPASPGSTSDARAATASSRSWVGTFQERDHRERTSIVTQLIGKTPTEKLEKMFGQDVFVDDDGVIRQEGLLRSELGRIDPETGKIVDERGFLIEDIGYLDEEGNPHRKPRII